MNRSFYCYDVLLKDKRSAGVVLFTGDRANPRFLLLKHIDGHWCFPKGHLLDGEDEIDCALRELEEETGIKREQLRFVMDFQRTIDYSYKRNNEVFHEESTFLLASVRSPVSISISSEHLDSTWATFEEAASLLRYENLVWVLASAKQNARCDLQETRSKTSKNQSFHEMSEETRLL